MAGTWKEGIENCRFLELGVLVVRGKSNESRFLWMFENNSERYGMFGMAGINQTFSIYIIF